MYKKDNSISEKMKNFLEMNFLIYNIIAEIYSRRRCW